jgi:hypothetical protein
LPFWALRAGCCVGREAGVDNVADPSFEGPECFFVGLSFSDFFGRRRRGRPVLAVLITAASVQDRDAARPLLWNLMGNDHRHDPPPRPPAAGRGPATRRLSFQSRL